MFLQCYSVARWPMFAHQWQPHNSSTAWTRVPFQPVKVSDSSGGSGSIRSSGQLGSQGNCIRSALRRQAHERLKGKH